MIKVIEHGKADYVAECDKCGCKFSYEIRDVVGGTVRCPDCGGHARHDRIFNGTPDSRTVDELYLEMPTIKSFEERTAINCKNFLEKINHNIQAEK